MVEEPSRHGGDFSKASSRCLISSCCDITSLCILRISRIISSCIFSPIAIAISCMIKLLSEPSCRGSKSHEPLAWQVSATRIVKYLIVSSTSFHKWLSFLLNTLFYRKNFSIVWFLYCPGKLQIQTKTRKSNFFCGAVSLYFHIQKFQSGFFTQETTVPYYSEISGQPQWTTLFTVWFLIEQATYPATLCVCFLLYIYVAIYL